MTPCLIAWNTAGAQYLWAGWRFSRQDPLELFKREKKRSHIISEESSWGRYSEKPPQVGVKDTVSQRPKWFVS